MAYITYQDGTNDRTVATSAFRHTVTAANATSGTVTLTFANVASIDAVLAFARTSAGLEKSGLVYTTSGATVTIANNGSTTTLVSGDVITVLALASRAI